MLHIRGLHKYFGGKAALHDVNLDLGAGERLALVGHNGSGKTTLIRCILGLHRFSGNIELRGYDPRLQHEHALGHVGFVPQTAPALRATVEEYLHLAESLSGADPKLVKDMAARLALDVSASLNTPFYKLSGGMKHKLLIAVAMARRPALLIFDEPTASLDPPARRSFFEMLAEMAQETAVIISSHRTDELVGIVTRLVELDSGHITMDEALAMSHSTQALTEVYTCSLVLSEDVPSLMHTLQQWGFETAAMPGHWTGLIAAPDRFRFLATLTRWSSVIRKLDWQEQEEQRHEESQRCEKPLYIS